MRYERNLSITEPLNLVLVDPGAGARGSARVALGSLDGIRGRALRIVSATVAHPDTLLGADVVIVDLTATAPTSFELLLETLKIVPTVPLLAVVGPGDPDLASRALVAGATAVVRRAEDDVEYAGRLAAAVADLEDSATGERQRRRDRLGRLARTQPQTFGRLVHRYAILIQARSTDGGDSMPGRHHRPAPADLRAIAEELSQLDAGPRDVVELHAMALRALRRDTSMGAQRQLNDVARRCLLELMGRLMDLYRARAARSQRTTGGADDGALA